MKKYWESTNKLANKIHRALGIACGGISQVSYKMLGKAVAGHMQNGDLSVFGEYKGTTWVYSPEDLQKIDDVVDSLVIIEETRDEAFGNYSNTCDISGDIITGIHEFFNECGTADSGIFIAWNKRNI